MNKDALGNQLFNVEVLSGNEIVSKQPVSVLIEKSGFNFSESMGDNRYLWGIGIINVILIVAIISMVIKMRDK